MNLIYARYNMYHNSIDITTFDGYILRIDCNKAENGRLFIPIPILSDKYLLLQHITFLEILSTSKIKHNSHNRCQKQSTHRI